MKKIIAMILMIAVLAMVLTGCAASSAAIAQPVKAAEDAELKEITGSCEIEQIDENTLRVHCTTNLINTTKIAVMLDSYSGENLAKEKLSIEAESFTVDFAIDDSWEFPVTASIVCMPSKYGRQLSAVKEAYGNKLQNVTGEYVIWNTESNMIVISSEEFNR